MQAGRDKRAGEAPAGEAARRLGQQEQAIKALPVRINRVRQRDRDISGSDRAAQNGPVALEQIRRVSHLIDDAGQTILRRLTKLLWIVFNFNRLCGFLGCFARIDGIEQGLRTSVEAAKRVFEGRFSPSCAKSSRKGDQKLHLRPVPIDQNCINLGPAPDIHRTNTVAPRPGLAHWRGDSQPGE